MVVLQVSVVLYVIHVNYVLDNESDRLVALMVDLRSEECEMHINYNKLLERSVIISLSPS